MDSNIQSIDVILNKTIFLLLTWLCLIQCKILTNTIHVKNLAVYADVSHVPYN